MTSPENGPSPEDMGLGHQNEENSDKKPKRVFKIIKPGEAKKLDIKLEDFKEVPKESTESEEDTEIKKQSISDWAEDWRGHVKVNKQSKLSEKERARDELKRLFGDKE